ncbi:uncharacterized protein VTP21DRAFT_1662 [Calcarisporiella thermophila]|uniref:uncharacterized protein n=1 Tax=Calcarisporiella thermophila TaxID=911321 RepID=UPI003743CB21
MSIASLLEGETRTLPMPHSQKHAGPPWPSAQHALPRQSEAEPSRLSVAPGTPRVEDIPPSRSTPQHPTKRKFPSSHQPLPPSARTKMQHSWSSDAALYSQPSHPPYPPPSAGHASPAITHKDFRAGEGRPRPSLHRNSRPAQPASPPRGYMHPGSTPPQPLAQVYPAHREQAPSMHSNREHGHPHYSPPPPPHLHHRPASYPPSVPQQGARYSSPAQKVSSPRPLDRQHSGGALPPPHKRPSYERAEPARPKLGATHVYIAYQIHSDQLRRRGAPPYHDTPPALSPQNIRPDHVYPPYWTEHSSTQRTGRPPTQYAPHPLPANEPAPYPPQRAKTPSRRSSLTTAPSRGLEPHPPLLPSRRHDPASGPPPPRRAYEDGPSHAMAQTDRFSNQWVSYRPSSQPRTPPYPAPAMAGQFHPPGPSSPYPARSPPRPPAYQAGPLPEPSPLSKSMPPSQSNPFPSSYSSPYAMVDSPARPPHLHAIPPNAQASSESAPPGWRSVKA